VDEQFSTGIAALDKLLGGGFARGSSTLLTGPPGTGKSSLAAQVACAVAARGGRAAMFVFDESVQTAVIRAEGLGMNMRQHLRDGLVTAQQVDPAELSPGEFSSVVRQAADRPGTELVVIDSLNGFLNAMPNERHLFVHLHELLTFLGHRGIASILVGVQGGLIGTSMVTPGDASFLADSVILLRYFEHLGAVRQAISVVKKRSSNHERTIREFRLDAGGVHVGAPLSEFHGVLTGIPRFIGETVTLMGRLDE
jgi:circadian clock protein KaiC